MTTADDAGGGERETAPERSSDDGPAPEGHECPFCGSTDTERESAFGSEVSKAQYYCNGCRTVFERIKYDGKAADTGR